MLFVNNFPLILLGFWVTVCLRRTTSVRHVVVIHGVEIPMWYVKLYNHVLETYEDYCVNLQE